MPTDQQGNSFVLRPKSMAGVLAAVTTAPVSSNCNLTEYDFLKVADEAEPTTRA